MIYTEEQLNYFRICYIVTTILTQALRSIFKKEWDRRYPSGEWNDTPKMDWTSSTWSVVGAENLMLVY